MQRILNLVILFCFFCCLTAATSVRTLSDCEVITMKDGTDIDAKVIEIGTTEIKYKNCDNQDGPTIVVLKKDVFSIKYTNGKKEMMSSKASSTEDDRKVEGLSLTSMILAILGFGPIPLVLGLIGLSKINKNPEKWSGKGFAATGVILGALWTFIIILYLVI